MSTTKPFLGWLVIVGMLMGFSPLWADNWPRFRGPNGTGIAADPNIPLRWSEGNGLLWKVAIPGIGHSSPVVWENNVFLQTAAEDGSSRTLLCLNASDGQLRWSRSVPAQKAHTHVKSSLASSTPATDGRRVCTMIWDGQRISLHMFDMDGNPLWKRDLGIWSSQHGAGASPILYADKVILNNDMDKDHNNVPGRTVLVALDANTGKPVWEVERLTHRACYSTPFILERPDAPPQLIVASTQGISGYDPHTGTEQWRWNWKFDGMKLRTVASPIAGGDLIFATSGDGGGARHAVAVRIGGRGDVTASHLAWENKRLLPYVPGMLYWNDHLYFVNDRGLAACVVAKTGEVVWSERMAGSFTASPVLIDGKVYAPADDGTVCVFKASPQFELLAKNPLGESVTASPAVANGRLFIRGSKHLFCIGHRSTR
ncbi:MAG: PQQ-binding-like beta-propeller repeat protein [Gemmataceae bacterium]|nr:PQQ-binding-like beta-propeller repeat protein [Gemmataceae bacterium]MDW8267459.1 PQQ-binding-like beta-propeller repeat protein [Gemmataceae bacterium]